MATVKYHKGGAMDMVFANGGGGRFVAMERTGWWDEAYSFLSLGGVRWWKGAREVERGSAGWKARRGVGVERVVSPGTDVERVANRGSIASQGSGLSTGSEASGGEWGGRKGKGRRGGDLVLVDGYGERFAVLGVGEGGGRLEVLKGGVEGAVLDEVVVSGVAWGVKRGLGRGRGGGEGDDLLGF